MPLVKLHSIVSATQVPMHPVKQINTEAAILQVLETLRKRSRKGSCTWSAAAAAQ